MGRFFLSGDFYLLKKSPHQCSQFAVYDRIFLAIDNMDFNHAFFCCLWSCTCLCFFCCLWSYIWPCFFCCLWYGLWPCFFLLFMILHHYYFLAVYDSAYNYYLLLFIIMHITMLFLAVSNLAYDYAFSCCLWSCI